jgi:hypothetical protein
MNFSSRTSPNQAPFSALFPVTISKPLTITSSNRFALALLIGAHRDSSWSNGNLIIAANLGNITLLQTAFYAVKLEVRRRNSL